METQAKLEPEGLEAKSAQVQSVGRRALMGPRAVVPKRNPDQMRQHLIDNCFKAENGCMEWKGAIFKGLGYGKINWCGKIWYAHRLSYELNHGAIPGGLEIMHSCDNRKCINPAHLSAGTHSDNMRDMFAKGRRDLSKVPRGVDHGMAKLNDDMVRFIRKSHAEGIATRKMARDLGLSQNAVKGVVLGRSWRHVK